MRIKLRWDLELIPKLALVIGVVAVLAVAVSEVHSFDVFWQLQSGKYIWQTKSLIYTDLFTLAKDAPRVEHTWLHSLILFTAYSAFGYSGISVLKGLLVTATMVVLMAVARIRKASWWAILIVVPVFLKTAGGWLERPQLWTFLLFALFVLVFERFQLKRDWKILLVLPLILFWVNVHAGSVLAAALAAAYIVGAMGQLALKKNLEQSGLLRLVLAVGLMFVGAQITPYPNQFFRTLLGVGKLGGRAATSSGSANGDAPSTAPMTQVFNMDWNLTTFQAEPFFYYAMGACVLIMLLGWRRMHLSDICLMIGLALMGLKLLRHVPFFYMGMVAIMPAYLDAATSQVRKRLPNVFRRVSRGSSFCVAVFAFMHFWQPLHNVYGAFNTGLREWHYPIEATEFVHKHNLPGNIYNTYDWGGYMAWQLYPDYLMFWDGRQNSKEMFRLGWNVMSGRHDWEQILNRFNVKTIVSRSATIDTGQRYPLLDRLRNHDAWSLVFNDESSLVFVRKGSVPDAWLKRYARPKEQIDNTVLNEAYLMTGVNPSRYMSWWSMTEIYMRRKQYSEAWYSLNQHLKWAPRPVPQATRLYQQLEPMYRN